MKNIRKILLFLTLVCSSTLSAQQIELDLSGDWQFRIDRNDTGEEEKWYAEELNDHIMLPGSMAENRKGDDVTLHTRWTASIYDSSFFFNPRLEKYRLQENLKLPFWLTPVKYYVGAAWYKKNVTIPDSYHNKRVILFLERPHTETVVWVNNKRVGMQNALSVPHTYEIGSLLKKGKNSITIRVDNRTKDIDVGKDSHSITDQTQGNWNGIVGKIGLYTTPLTYIEDLQVYPDIKNKKAIAKVHIIGRGSGEITIEAESFNSVKDDRIAPVKKSFTLKNKSGLVEIELPMGDEFLTWDEFEPNLYRLKATLTTKKGTDVRETRFGMREFTIKGKSFFVNGRKTMLRGTVENCVFPLTGYAPMDVESWIRVFRICRNYGLNHMRFHSYCPPEAAMEAADRVGFYLQPEGPSWPNHGTSLGDGRPVDDYLWEEAKRIVKSYGNYPSFCLFAIGNEPRGRWVPWVTKFVEYWKETDSRRVYTGASVGGSWAWQPASQYHVKAGARGLDWDRRPNSRSDFSERINSVNEPFVSHETGQWCVFPDFKEIDRYTGVMKARNFELFRQDLKDRNMGDMGAQFLMASGKLQALCYKHEIERTLRTPDYAGFQLLSLNDYSGQGTALVGVLNAFWEEKGYMDAAAFRQFCAPTVLLSQMDKYVFRNNEQFTADIEISHFGREELVKESVYWSVQDEYGHVYTKGVLPPADIQIGNGQKLGTIHVPLNDIEKAQKMNLKVWLNCKEVMNNWDFWVYPSILPEVHGDDIHITDTLDEQTRNILVNGGKVLFLTAGKVEQGKEVVQTMTPAFWNTSWFKMRPPHTVGTLINNHHAIFSDFPTDYYTELQWWELVHKAQVMELNSFPAEFQPLVQPIDTWFINRKLGMLFETKTGNGKLVVCSIDLKNDLKNRPVAAQLRHSILTYMNSNLFHPEQEVALSMIEEIVTVEGEKLHINTKDAPDELKGVVR
ncbi:MAG: sugar-binding domain-containing protein [Proteiniphilum sp.]